MNVPFIPTGEDNLTNIDQSTDDWRYPLDLNRLILPRPASTFLLRADSDRCDVLAGDIMVVDRSLTPSNDQLVVAVEGGEMVVARHPVSEIWGVVTHIIRGVR